jgi:hypothetical protein
MKADTLCFMMRVPLLVCLALSACVTLTSHRAPDGDQPAVTVWADGGGKTSLTYQSPSFVLAEADRQAALELKPVDNFYPNGLAVFTIERHALGAAETQHHVAIFLKNGMEVGRVEGPRSFPSAPSSLHDFWWNYLFAPVPAGLEPPFEVRLVDRVLVQDFRFLVDASGRVTNLGKGGNSVGPGKCGALLCE